MGGSIFLSIIQKFSIPVDSLTCFPLLFNFTVVGVLSVFSKGVPILLRQGYTVCLGIIVAAWFTKLPEWTTWKLLVACAIYDLVAVLAPGGPLKIWVELASSRNDELPVFVYEARRTAVRGHRTDLGMLVGGVSDERSVELQSIGRENVGRWDMSDDGESLPLVGNFGSRGLDRGSPSSSSGEVSSSVANVGGEIEKWKSKICHRQWR